MPSTSPSESSTQGTQSPADVPLADGESASSSDDDQVPLKVETPGTSGPHSEPSLARSVDSPQLQNAKQQKSAKSLETGKISEKTYCLLLNEQIADARDGPSLELDILAPSQIGASWWTTNEKRRFFDALLVSGRGNLQDLSRGVRTKSESECHVYVRQLEESSCLMQSPGPNIDIVSEIPIACEITGKCETLLERAADKLASRIAGEEGKLERSIYGDDHWLIDAIAADSIDAALDTDIAEQEASEDEEPSSVKEDPKIAEDAEVPPQSSFTLSPESLLRPSSFLQLSTNLFMNSNELENNWECMVPLFPSETGPALFRSALEDLRNLMVSFTRRLVSVTLTQACSRLRANDRSRNPSIPLVRDIDVRTACEVLEINANWDEYWATAARRCRVSVYSNSKRYMDGRPGTKNGTLLSYDEVEREMGIVSGALSPEVDVSIGEDEIEAALDDDELIMHELCSDSSDAGSEPENNQNNSSSRQKRKQSSASQVPDVIEDAYMEQRDIVASAREEVRIWRMSDLPVPEELVSISDAVTSAPSVKIVSDDNRERSWRARTRYVAEWEYPRTPVNPEAFRITETFGSGQRKRRKIILDAVRTRIAGDAHADELTSGEEGNTYETSPLGSE